MNLFDLSRRSLATEAESSSGLVDTEIEYTYYAKLTDITFLMYAVSTEIHEQFEIKLPVENDLKSRLRIRKTTQEGLDGVKYIQTIKIDQASTDVNNSRQVAVEVTKSLYETLLAVHGGYGMRKRRYTIPACIKDLSRGMWEVDVFIDSTGKPTTPWVKIDLELPKDIQIPRPALPKAFKNAIFDHNLPTDADMIDQLYKTYFITYLLD